MRIIQKNGMYDIYALEIAQNHPDRTFAPNIERDGNVHLNILDPGVRAGGHYHKETLEYFVNPGPSALLLHLQNPQTGHVEVVELPPPTLDEVRAYHPKQGTPHIVENPGPHRAALIILVDKDRPEDVYSASVSALGICADITELSTDKLLQSKRQEARLERGKLRRAAGGQIECER